MSWPATSPGPVATGVAVVVLGYFLVVEPWWGRAEFARLRRTRDHDPGALVRFARLTVGVQGAAVAIVALTVVLDPGVGPRDVGLALPTAPGGAFSGVVTGGLVGMAVGLAVAVGFGIRAVRTGKGLSVAPDGISPMVPVTRTERWWAAALCCGAGISEELVFRGLLLAVAVGWGLHPVLAAVGLAVLFGAAHLYQGLAGVVTTTLFGLVMSAVVLGTRSVLLAMLLHALVDLRSLLLTRPAEPPAWVRGGPTG